MPPRKGTGKPRQKGTARPAEVDAYHHPEATSPMRPDVGAQPTYKATRPPATYRYDSSLAPELAWDGLNAAREQGEALIRQIAEAGSLAEAKAAAERLRAMSRPFLN